MQSLQNDHLNGLLMNYKRNFAILFLKGTQIPKFHICGRHIKMIFYIGVSQYRWVLLFFYSKIMHKYKALDYHWLALWSSVNPYHAEMYTQDITCMLNCFEEISQNLAFFCFCSVVKILVNITSIFTGNGVSWVYFKFQNFGDTFYHGCHSNIFSP